MYLLIPKRVFYTCFWVKRLPDVVRASGDLVRLSWKNLLQNTLRRRFGPEKGDLSHWCAPSYL